MTIFQVVAPTDEQGLRCAGEVTVWVPHDQRPGHACVDQGPLVDSAGSCP